MSDEFDVACDVDWQPHTIAETASNKPVIIRTFSDFFIKLPP